MSGHGGAEMYPDAENDLLGMHRGPTKTAIKQLLRGTDVVTDDEIDIQNLRDPHQGWSVCRVNGYLVLYKPLTEDQRADLGRTVKRLAGLGEALVARIVPLEDYVHLYLAALMTQTPSW